MKAIYLIMSTHTVHFSYHSHWPVCVHIASNGGHFIEDQSSLNSVPIAENAPRFRPPTIDVRYKLCINCIWLLTDCRRCISCSVELSFSSIDLSVVFTLVKIIFANLSIYVCWFALRVLTGFDYRSNKICYLISVIRVSVCFAMQRLSWNSPLYRRGETRRWPSLNRRWLRLKCKKAHSVWLSFLSR